jgi:hypothetical protein
MKKRPPEGGRYEGNAAGSEGITAFDPIYDGGWRK